MSDENKTGFTDGESKLLLSALTHLKGNIDVTDWSAVANDMGYKSAEIAKVRWGQIKRKKIQSATSDKNNNGAKKASPGGKKGTKREADAEADDANITPSTTPKGEKGSEDELTAPSAPKRKPGRPAKKAKTEDKVTTGAEEEVKAEVEE